MFKSSYCSTVRSLSSVSPPKRVLRTITGQVPSIKPNSEEARAGKLTERNLERAVRAVLQDGLVVVENAIEHSYLDKLNKKMMEDSKYLSSLGDKSPFNYNKGNMQQDAPPLKDFFEPSIFLSKSRFPPNSIV